MQTFDEFLLNKWEKYNLYDGARVEFTEWLSKLRVDQIVDYANEWHSQIVNKLIDDVRKSIIGDVLEITGGSK